MENILRGRKFGFSEVIKSTMEVCANDYGQYLLLALLVSAVTMVPSIIQVAVTEFIKNPGIMMLTYLGVFVLSLFVYYFTARFTIVVFYTIHDNIHGVERTFGQRYNDAGAVIWKYIGVSLLLGLMAAGIYLIFIIFGFISAISASMLESRTALVLMMVGGGTFVLGVVAFLYLMLGMSIPIRVFEPNVVEYFSASVRLVKGHKRILLLVGLIFGLLQLLLVGTLIYLMFTGAIGMMVYYSVAIIFTALTAPIGSCAYIVSYLLMKQGQDEEAQQNEELLSTL